MTIQSVLQTDEFRSLLMAMTKQQHFQQLTYPWRDRLYNVALRRATHLQVAEDWVQETLLRAWCDFKHLKAEIAIYAWLLKILDHVIADDKRREKRRHQIAPMLTVDDKDLLAHPSSEPEPFDNVVSQQTQDQIMSEILKLPEEYSNAILLKDIEGLSYKDIAYILQIPKGTVMSRLSRGRRMLSHSLLQFSNTNQLDSPNNSLHILGKEK